MWLHPSQKLSSGNSSAVLASLGAPSWGAEQSCRVGDQLWVPPLLTSPSTACSRDRFGYKWQRSGLHHALRPPRPSSARNTARRP